MSQELIRLGHDVMGSIAHRLSTGAGDVHVQLLASRFYEALKDELERTRPDDTDLRAVLVTAKNQCGRCAQPGMARR